MFDLKEELKKLPDNPGVYLMHNADGDVIYVGKAKVLKNRVRQYFQSSANHTPKVKAMVSNIAYFEYIVTDSETEALALECNLIKKYRPKYNILLKDDKHYPYLKVTLNDEYPKLLKVRKVINDGAKYYGPYVCGATVKSTLDIIQKLFKPPTCHRRFPKDIKKGRPCLNYHINNCFAPCTGRVTKAEYRRIFNDISKFLDGNHGDLIKTFKEEMKEASDNLEFERAASVRDKIIAIEDIAKNQKIINANNRSDRDVIALAREDNNAFCEIFFVRNGKVIGRENYKIEISVYDTSNEIISDFVKQYYEESGYIPPEISTQYEVIDKDAIEDWLNTKAKRKVHLNTPKRGEKANMVAMVHKNAKLALSNYKMNIIKAYEKNTVLDNLKELLDLDKVPQRIEAYDISNISGSDNVGAMIVFENGKCKRSKKRIFKIKSFDGADDYASMSEVIYRRFRHAMDEEELIEKGEMKKEDAKFLPYPDLILLDGGKGHLNTISELMDMMDRDIKLFGMVKNNKHRTRALTGKDGEIEISAISPVFKLITNIQDEVHNAAIEYHRKLRSKIDSEIDKIEGVGEKRRKILLTQLGSVDKIKEATIEEIASLNGIDKRTAENVYLYFHKDGEE